MCIYVMEDLNKFLNFLEAKKVDLEKFVILLVNGLNF